MDHEVLDQSVISDLINVLGGKMDNGLYELVEAYLENAHGMLVELDQAVRAGDASCVFRLGHDLKSSSGMYGARHFSALCKEIEMAGRNGVLEGVLEKVAHVRREFELVRAALLEQVQV